MPVNGAVRAFQGLHGKPVAGRSRDPFPTRRISNLSVFISHPPYQEGSDIHGPTPKKVFAANCRRSGGRPRDGETIEPVRADRGEFLGNGLDAAPALHGTGVDIG